MIEASEPKFKTRRRVARDAAMVISAWTAVTLLVYFGCYFFAIRFRTASESQVVSVILCVPILIITSVGFVCAVWTSVRSVIRPPLDDEPDIDHAIIAAGESTFQPTSPKQTPALFDGFFLASSTLLDIILVVAGLIWVFNKLAAP